MKQKSLLILPLLIGSLHAQEGGSDDSLTAALQNGKANIDARLRHEYGDQEGRKTLTHLQGASALGIKLHLSKG